MAPPTVRTIDLFTQWPSTAPKDLPKFNPGEMILRLTPAAQEAITTMNPLGLRPAVLAFLNELPARGLWRIEPLVQLGFRVWNLEVTGAPVPGMPPVVPPASIPAALGPETRSLYRFLQYGDNASRKIDAIPAGDRWIKPLPFVPTRSPGIDPALRTVIGQRLMLRFDPNLLTDRLAVTLVALAKQRLNLPGQAPLMLDLERTPLRLIFDQPYSATPVADWGTLAMQLPNNSSNFDPGPPLGLTGSTKVDLPAPAEKVYPPGWHKDSIGYNNVPCMKTSKAMVAVLDSGVDLNHPALKKVVTAGDPNYIIDYVGHGTHVCSILAGRGLTATSNPVGLLPMGSLRVYKVMSDGLISWKGRYFYPVDTVLYASAMVDLRSQVSAKLLRVINLSLGGETPLSGSERSDLDELSKRDAVIVAAAGNHLDAGDFTAVLYPAAYSNAIAVAAFRLELTNATDPTSSYRRDWEGTNSGGGTEKPGRGVALSAPGRNIFAALPTNATLMLANNQGYLTGTSMATPIVAAAVAVYLANYPNEVPSSLLIKLKGNNTVKPSQDNRLALGNKLGQFGVCPVSAPT